MKTVIIIAILIGIGLPILNYKRDKELKNLLISFLLLGGIISLIIVGNVMRSILPFFLAHIIALILAYGSYILYLIKGRLYWYIYLLPFSTLALYIIIAFIGNRHISWF